MIDKDYDRCQDVDNMYIYICKVMYDIIYSIYIMYLLTAYQYIPFNTWFSSHGSDSLFPLDPTFVGMALPILGETNCASSAESGSMKWVSSTSCWFSMFPSIWWWLLLVVVVAVAGVVVVVVLVLPSCQVAMNIFLSLWDWDLSSWLLTCSLAETCFLSTRSMRKRHQPYFG